jgi:hypothetical protein
MLKLILSILLLSGCTFTTSISMKCKGECSLDVEREIETVEVPNLKEERRRLMQYPVPE